jgi:hypothetical protein
MHFIETLPNKYKDNIEIGLTTVKDDGKDLTQLSKELVQW